MGGSPTPSSANLDLHMAQGVPAPPHSGPFQLVPPEAKKEPLCGALAPSPFASLLHPPAPPADEVLAPSSS